MPDLIIRMSLDHARTSFDRSNLSRPSLPAALCARQLPCEDVILVRTSPNLVLMTLHNFKFLRIFLVQTQHSLIKNLRAFRIPSIIPLVFLDFHFNIHFSLKKNISCLYFSHAGCYKTGKGYSGESLWRKMAKANRPGLNIENK